MGFSHGTAARFYHHTLDMSAYIESVDPEFTRETADIKAHGESWTQRVAGIRVATISLAGVYDGAAGGPAALAWAQFIADTSRPWMYLPYGDTLDYACYMGLSDLGSLQITAGNNDAVRYPVGCLGSTEVDRGEVLHTLSQETATGAETSVNDLSQSTNGGVGVLICTALNATETLDVLIEHSANNSDWSTLITFTQLAAIGSERKEITTNPVKQYLRASWTLSEGGIATFAVAFAWR
jgi:hypothetical protein